VSVRSLARLFQRRGRRYRPGFDAGADVSLTECLGELHFNLGRLSAFDSLIALRPAPVALTPAGCGVLPDRHPEWGCHGTRVTWNQPNLPLERPASHPVRARP
jgi:hypothetical protein